MESEYAVRAAGPRDRRRPDPGDAGGDVRGLLTGGAAALVFAYAPRGPRRGPVQAAAYAGALMVLVVAAVVKVGELTSGGVL
ncbi:hypothetical protein [Streptomyces sp. CC219B]|uniref:hypothetical protein n=1 Tax=Streptomyces sp. CC219B TaxID=3044574 RepID=UPI0024A9AE92|nr:hypothetical protein [Streptomyces sp. CC219B]